MADLTEQIGKVLEDGWYELIRKLAFGLGVDDNGDAQTIAIRKWRDGASDISYPAVIIQAQRAVPEYCVAGPLYGVDVSLIAMTHASFDADQTDLNTISGKLEALIANTSNAELEAETPNMDIGGIEIFDTPATMDGMRQEISVDTIIHINATLGNPATTTTTTTTTTT